MKCFAVLFLISMIYAQSYGQEIGSQTVDSSKIKTDNTGSKLESKSLEVLFFTNFGLGLRLQKDLAKFTTLFTLYTFLDPYSAVGRQSTVRAWDDTAIYNLDHWVTSQETGIRVGISERNNLIDWSVSGFLSYSERERHFVNKYTHYERDSSTGIIQYINPQTRERAYLPVNSIYVYESWDGNIEKLQSLRFGISPGVRAHTKRGLFEFSVNVNYDFGWNMLLVKKGKDPIGISDMPSNYFYDAIRAYFAVGIMLDL